MEERPPPEDFYMNLEGLRTYLIGKTEKNELEKIALTAVNDENFINTYGSLKYFESIPGFVDVLNDPTSHGNVVSAHYTHLLVELSSTYKAYLYDTKGKYSAIKSAQQEIIENINRVKSDIINIEQVSKAISGEKVLNVYAKEFKKRASAYQRAARRWMKFLVGSYFVVAIVVILIFTINVTDTKEIYALIADEFKPFLQIALLVFKALVLLGAVQLSRFFARNFNANMHLYQQTLHKHDVLRSLQGAYNTISVDNISARDELIKTGAIIAFQNIESGYITTKEGAGDADAYTNSLLANIIKR